jgi:hypothetical protein
LAAFFGSALLAICFFAEWSRRFFAVVIIARRLAAFLEIFFCVERDGQLFTVDLLFLLLLLANVV